MTFRRSLLFSAVAATAWLAPANPVAAAGDLQAGLAAVDITPPVPLPHVRLLQ